MGTRLLCCTGERQRGAQSPQQRLSGVGVRVRAANLCLLGSRNLAGVCPGLKLAKRGLGFTAPLVVPSVFQER